MARPRADNYAEKQQLILDQAAVLFAQKGFAGSSISTLAKSCNTSKALIYHYYPAKESLLYAMLSDHIDHLLEAARQALVSFEIRYGVHVYYSRSRKDIARWILDRAIKFYKVQREADK